jgi:thymidylate kinase
MIIVLNGPLGIGKTTLADALMENVQQCVMLNGDHLVAANPPPADELEHLHSTIALLVAHYRRSGYRHFVIDHIWTTTAQLNDLRQRLADLDTDFRCFLLTLSIDENLRRIERRTSVSALDEVEVELRIALQERDELMQHSGEGLGEPFDVSASPPALVKTMLNLLGLPSSEISR